MLLRLLVCCFSFSFTCICAQQTPVIKLYSVDTAWAGNSVNTVAFRKNSLVSFKDFQFISYYDAGGTVILGKRKHGAAKWTLKNTGIKGDIKDAHNSISIGIDGKGFLHLAWGNHNSQLNYCKSKAALSLEMDVPQSMTGKNELSVTYPEFYKMPGGDLLFLYRDGGSGRGNLVINRYKLAANSWSRVADNLIDGEGRRNAYWQCYLDDAGTFHISWVWRDTPDVATNHDLCYARSRDGGVSWERSNGQPYTLPINLSNAEIICNIPQKSELINQTSMTADLKGNPIVASYWKETTDPVPQYHVVYRSGNQWYTVNLRFRSTPFSLSGAGTKQIPIARPQIISWQEKGRTCAALIFRDQERNNKASIAFNPSLLNKDGWQIADLDLQDLGSWEPTFDIERWKQKHQLHLFIQKVAQADAEGLTGLSSQPVSVLEWNLKWKKN